MADQLDIDNTHTTRESLAASTAPESSKQRIAILGSTGSIGQSTLDVVARHRDKFEVYALSANTNAEQLYAQCVAHQPQLAVIADASSAAWLEAELKKSGLETELAVGPEALCSVASHSGIDTVMAAIVGAAGMHSTLAAAAAGKKVLLANKEALVVAGELMLQALRRGQGCLLPVDSEHNAIFQCLPPHMLATNFSPSYRSSTVSDMAQTGIKKLLLTGSGGPFRELPLTAFDSVTPAQACAHPNWSMGRKISVDSATMMNKALELIEATWLFNCDHSDIDILLHPQSIVHSMVEYLDGSVIAQLGQADMRTPIAHALAWPQRIETAVQSLDWSTLSALNFEQPDQRRFPALKLAREVAEAGGSAAAVLNAANEIAVDAFLREQIRFTDIVDIADACLNRIANVEPASLDIIQQIDRQARDIAQSLVVAAARK